MTIRSATEDDVESIRRVAEASWEADYPNVMSRETIDEGVADWYSRERIRESLIWSRSYMLVAERDGEIVGFVHADLLPEDEVGHILRVYVHPEHRRHGLGRELLTGACRTLFDEGAAHVKAMVLEGNELGKSFYREFGFESNTTGDILIGEETYRETTFTLGEDALMSIAESTAQE